MTEQPLRLTAIYNKHGNTSDAEATLSHIVPDSIVFREGVVRPSHHDIYENTMELARLRLEAGYYTDEALQLAHDIWVARNSSESQLAMQSRGYHARLLPGLIEKNCVLFPADYVDTTGDGLYVDDANWVWADMQRMLREKSPRNIKRYIDADTTHTELWIRENRVREEAAVARVKEVFGRLAVGGTFGLGTQAYIIYGAYHRRSLTQRIADAGIKLAAIKYVLPQKTIDTLEDLATLTDVTIAERREAVRAALLDFIG